MRFPNGATDEHQPDHRGHDDVTITIRGRTAARMLGRADDLAGIIERLEALEAANAQRATQQEALKEVLGGLQEKVAQLAGQVADQIAEVRVGLDSLRNDHEVHANATRFLPARIEELQRQMLTLQTQLHPVQGDLGQVRGDLLQLQGELDQLQRQTGSLPASVSSLETRVETLEHGWRRLFRRPSKPRANGDDSASTSWLKQRIHGLGLW